MIKSKRIDDSENDLLASCEFLNNYDRFIPASWKRLYAFLKGVSDSNLSDIKKYSTAEDAPSLYDIAAELSIDVFKTAHTKLPLYDDGLADTDGYPVHLEPWSDMDWSYIKRMMHCIKAVAASIAKEYERAKKRIEKLNNQLFMNCLDPLVTLERECQLVINICDIFIDGRRYDLFNLVYDKLLVLDSNHEFPFNLTAKTFHSVLFDSHVQNSGGILIGIRNDEDDFSSYHYDDWSITMRFNKGHGMSAYAFLLFYRNVSISSIDADWSYYKLVQPQSWIFQYLADATFNKVESYAINQVDLKTWSSLVHRPVFSDLFTIANLASILAEGYGFDIFEIKTHLARMTAKSNDITELKHLYRIVLDETNYLLRNRLAVSNCFVYKDMYSQIEDSLAEDLSHVNCSDEKVNKLFNGLFDEEESILAALQERVMYYSPALFLHRPEAHCYIVREKIDEIILHNEETKRIIREALDEMQIIQPSIIHKNIDVPQLSSPAEKARIAAYEAGYVDSQGVLIASKAELAKWLVLTGFVTRPEGWSAISPDGLESIYDNLTRSLYWKGMTGFFIKDNKTEKTVLPPGEIRKAFADGDPNGGFRIEVFKEVILRNRHK